MKSYGHLELWILGSAEIIINPVRITAADFVLPGRQ